MFTIFHVASLPLTPGVTRPETKTLSSHRYYHHHQHYLQYHRYLNRLFLMDQWKII